MFKLENKNDWNGSNYKQTTCKLALHMADQQQLELLLKGVKGWNKWRSDNSEVKIDLSKANLFGVDLIGANLSEVNLAEAELWLAKLKGSNLSKANLSYASLLMSDLSEADLSYANLRVANLPYTNLTGSDLSGADLTGVTLVKTIVNQAKLTGCHIYGLSVWDIEGIPAKQENLIITPKGETEITVDDLEVAQFIYLLLKNKKLKNIIDTITSKAVLILGRFTDERKMVLDALREELRKLNFTPILFDFDKPGSKDVTGTVETLARMARFIIADLTDPSSIPHELATIIPFLRTTPVLPIRLQGSGGYSMFEDFQRSYQWVLKTYEYQDGNSLVSVLPQVIAPANEKAEALRKSI